MSKNEDVRRRLEDFLERRFDLIIVVALILCGLVIFAQSKPGPIDRGDALVGFATIFLGFATMLLGFTEMNTSRISRRMSRIKDQLDRLYSPIFGIGENEFMEHWRHKDVNDYIYQLMNEIRSRYKYLASPELRELLDEYYQHPKERGKFLRDIWNCVVKDFNDLSEEYNYLTRRRLVM